MAIVAVSEPEHRAFVERRPSDLERIAPSTWTIGLLAPVYGHHVTQCSLLVDEDGGGHLIDPGIDAPENIPRIAGALTAAGSGLEALRSVVVTHAHRDHLGLAGRLAQLTGASVLLHEREWRDVAAAVPPPTPDEVRARWGAPAEADLWKRPPDDAIPDPASVRTLADGDLLDIPGRVVQVLHTPGHTPGSVCLADDENGLLWTGDHVLPHLAAGLGLGADDIDPVGDMLSSLARVRDRGPVALPGHGYRFRGLPERVDELVARIEARRDDVRAAAARAGTVWAVAERVRWTGGFAGLEGHLLWNALHQTELYLRHLGIRLADH
jgi:glyoxylase-like metal-dependent hydrolase (beta-lactamase superfamily II)